MHFFVLFIWWAFIVLGFSGICIRLGWALVTRSAKKNKKVFKVPEVFKSTRGKKGEHGIYELSEAQANRLITGAKEGLVFMIPLPKDDDEVKLKESLVDQELSFQDLATEGLVTLLEEKEHTKDLKSNMKELARPCQVFKLSEQGFKMFSNADRKAN